MDRTIIRQMVLEELRAAAVITLVVMVHEVKNRISCIEQWIVIRIVLYIFLYQSYQVLLSIILQQF